MTGARNMSRSLFQTAPPQLTHTQVGHIVFVFVFVFVIVFDCICIRSDDLKQNNIL